MDMTRGLQEVVSRNVRVLMAVHDITHQKDLAGQLDWGADKLTRTLKGDRRWSLDDLAELAHAFGVTPAALLSDTAELVGASHPKAVSQGSSRRYHGTNSGVLLPFPQARAERWRYLTGDAQSTTHSARPGRDHIGPVTVLSNRPITSVTAAVGT